jgi:hypothetical protein
MISLGTLKLNFYKADSLWVRQLHLHIHSTTIDSCNWRVLFLVQPNFGAAAGESVFC